jgi:hypothetical protein
VLREENELAAKWHPLPAADMVQVIAIAAPAENVG